MLGVFYFLKHHRFSPYTNDKDNFKLLNFENKDIIEAFEILNVFFSSLREFFFFLFLLT